MKRILLAALLSVVALPVSACRLALALAIDISNSVDGSEFRIQTEGLADALLDPVVREALGRGDTTLTVFLWSGPNSQYVVLPWRQIRNDADVLATSAHVRAIRRIYGQSNTAIGNALAFALDLFDDVPECERRTVDISGDGVANAGASVADQRDVAQQEGITVNALAIDRDEGLVTAYFSTHLITRNGFVLTSRGHDAYADTLKRKLRRELSEPTM